MGLHVYMKTTALTTGITDEDFMDVLSLVDGSTTQPILDIMALRVYSEKPSKPEIKTAVYNSGLHYYNLQHQNRDVLSILSTEFDKTIRDKILTTELVNNIHMIFNQPEPEQEISTPVQTKDFNALDVLDHLRIEVEKVKEGLEPNKKQAVELAIQKEVNNLKR
ncbi:uncharacterized protein LOC111699651 isoform X1 [Eurytemora carolleeae]|uniref:uncharacterized protein LOC111699651 isoform X1 n=2 Tax=Eurytemora carolleeae TaxID=1294199 RepID=UPI000C78E2BD|nr:uncharacterized protein LOC111699651 isoform X1 [Eurytemora carolleeae]|eukprot:XP_023326143.1 uncharacterized protein LOC111699651 isoform X1 [Eurytemora affinis]